MTTEAKPKKRLTKKQQRQVCEWLREAYNIGFSGLNGHKLTPTQHEQRRTICEDALIAAVLTYDSSKGASFSTFLYRKVRWAIIDAARPRKSKPGQARTFTDLLAEE